MALSVSVVICERALYEQDHVLSAIRISDLFKFEVRDGVPLEAQSVQMTAIVIAREIISPEPIDRFHLQLQLIRPSGQLVSIGHGVEVALQSNEPNTPRGVNLIAPFGVIPSEEGSHFLVVLINGVETTRTPILMKRATPQDQFGRMLA